MRALLLFLALFLLACAAVRPARAATAEVWVDPDFGDDDFNSGEDIDDALATIAAALAVVQSEALGPASTTEYVVILLPGEYTVYNTGTVVDLPELNLTVAGFTGDPADVRFDVQSNAELMCFANLSNADISGFTIVSSEHDLDAGTNDACRSGFARLLMFSAMVGLSTVHHVSADASENDVSFSSLAAFYNSRAVVRDVFIDTPLRVERREGGVFFWAGGPEEGEGESFTVERVELRNVFGDESTAGVAVYGEESEEGGVVSLPEVTITSSTFFGVASIGIGPAAVLLDACTATIHNSTFDSCYAGTQDEEGNTIEGTTQEAGAVALFSTNTTISSCTFRNNRATVGGAVSVIDTGRERAARAVVSRDNVYDRNVAVNGGSVHVEEASFYSYNDTFTGNRVAEVGSQFASGSAAFFANAEVVRFEGALFEENIGLDVGAGVPDGTGVLEAAALGVSATSGTLEIRAASSFRVNEYVVERSRFYRNEALDGAGLRAFFGTGSGASLLVSDCEFEANVASATGGGVSLINEEPSDSMRAVGCAFRNNSALEAGGAVFASGAGQSVVESCTLEQNSADSGGGAYVTASGLSGRLLVTGATVVTGNAATTRGGGLCANTGGRLEVGGALVVANNTARLQGGGAAVSGGGSVLDAEGAAANGSRCEGNAVDALASQGGGCISVTVGGDARLAGWELDGNAAPSISGAGGGAALVELGSTASFARCSFRRGSSGTNGGALSVATGGSATVTNCTFVGNLAAVAGGAAHVGDGSTLSVEGSDSSDCEARVGGHLSASRASALTAQRTTLRGGSADQGGGLHVAADCSGDGASDGNVTVTGVTFVGTSAARGGGGAFWAGAGCGSAAGGCAASGACSGNATASYGELEATPPATLGFEDAGTPAVLAALDYGETVEFGMRVADGFGQTVRGRDAEQSAVDVVPADEAGLAQVELALDGATAVEPDAGTGVSSFRLTITGEAEYEGYVLEFTLRDPIGATIFSLPVSAGIGQCGVWQELQSTAKRTCRLCSGDQFALDRGGVCYACPEGAICNPSSFEVLAARNHWRDPAVPDERLHLKRAFYRCRVGTCCERDSGCASTEQCPDGRTGLLCADCPAGTAPAATGGACLECDGWDPGAVALWTAFVVGSALYLLLSGGSLPRVGIALFFLQNAPLVVNDGSDAVRAAKLFNFDPLALLFSGVCVPLSAFDRLVSPLFSVAASVATVAIVLSLSAVVPFLRRGPFRSRLRRQVLFRRALARLYQLAYTSFTLTAFNLVSCRDVAGTLVLNALPSQRCWEGKHLPWGVAGFVVLFFVSLLSPFAVAVRVRALLRARGNGKRGRFSSSASLGSGGGGGDDEIDIDAVDEATQQEMVAVSGYDQFYIDFDERNSLYFLATLAQRVAIVGGSIYVIEPFVKNSFMFFAISLFAAVAVWRAPYGRGVDDALLVAVLWGLAAVSSMEQRAATADEDSARILQFAVAGLVGSAFLAATLADALARWRRRDEGQTKSESSVELQQQA